MKYVKKLINLPEDLAAQLQQEANMSATVTEALTKHYAGKDAAKQLVALAQSIGEELVEIRENNTEHHKLLRKIALFMQSQGADIRV